MFFEVKKIFIFFPFLQSDSTAIFLGKKRSKLKFFTLNPSNKQFKTAS